MSTVKSPPATLFTPRWLQGRAWISWSFAILLPVLTLLLRLAFRDYMPDVTFRSFLPSMLVITVIGGTGPGATTAVISALLALGYLTDPPGLIPASSQVWADLTFYALICMVVITLAHRTAHAAAQRFQAVAAQTAERESALRAQLETAAEVERLRDQDRLRGALLSSVSHDLRTPLTSILAAAAQLRSEGRADPGTLAMLDAEARRLDRYVANLLDMVRIEAGALRLKLEPVDLTDAVASVLADHGKGSAVSSVRTDVPADLPLVRLDAQLFHHCLLNLVDNALRHGGGGLVTIRGERTAAGVTISVLDEGPGLPSGQEVRIFETFVRLMGSDRQGGTGLGLAIVKGFANAMGLKVKAGNRPDGSGAAFILTIPPTHLVETIAMEAE